MELLDPRVIVTLGRHSMLRFYPKGKISKDHGKILEWEGRVLFPLYHPAAGLRNPAIKKVLQEDVLRLPEAIRESIRLSAPVPNTENPEIPEPQQVEQPTQPPIAEAPSTNEAEAQLFEPLLMSETPKEKEKETEEGDRQLGMF